MENGTTQNYNINGYVVFREDDTTQYKIEVLKKISDRAAQETKSMEENKEFADMQVSEAEKLLARGQECAEIFHRAIQRSCSDLDTYYNLKQEDIKDDKKLTTVADIEKTTDNLRVFKKSYIKALKTVEERKLNLEQLKDNSKVIAGCIEFSKIREGIINAEIARLEVLNKNMT